MTDILAVAEALAVEKGIEKELVFEAIEMAMQRAGRSKYGQEFDIRATINRENGAIKIARYREVVEEPESEAREITLADARAIEPDIALGQHVIQDLPEVNFGRVAALTARQVITQKVREAERERQYEEFKDKAGQIISGAVKRKEYGNIIVDLGTAEGFMRRDQTLGRENFERGERVRAYVMEVRRETRGPQIFLSRADQRFIGGLFRMEVPEIYDNLVEIKAVAHEPGSRAKIAVYSKDSSVDPVGACVGMRGSRVQAVVSELKGEKIDIITWSSDTATFVVNALSPVEISKVVIDEDSHRIEVVVPESQLSLAIGRRGQNVRLAAQLTGWELDILTEEVEAERRNEEFKVKSQRFMEALDVDDVIAQLLVTEGFSDVTELASTGIEELSGIESFSADMAVELHKRAQHYIKEKRRKFLKRLSELGMDARLECLPHLGEEGIVALSEKGLRTLDDVGDLAGDELQKLLDQETLTRAQADEVVLAARAHWFAEEDARKEASEATEKEKEDAAPLPPPSSPAAGGAKE